MPCTSATRSARPSATSTIPRAASGFSHDPPCGLGYSKTVPPARRSPAASASLTHNSAWRTSAAGSTPIGSSAVVGSSSNWIRPLLALRIIRSGYLGSGPGASGFGKKSDAGCSPRSSTT